MVKKYNFCKKLKEGILTGRIKGQALVVVDGKEQTAQCSAWDKISCTKRLPCLVSEDHSRGSIRYIVEAVSFDNEGGKRNWVCLRPVLFEQAVEYFLEKHQLGNMLVDYDYVNKVSSATAGKCRPDFQVGSAWVEVRHLGSRLSGSVQESPAFSMKQIENYCKRIAAVKEPAERMILFLICQDGTQDKLLSFMGKASDMIKKAVEAGVELWTAEMQFDVDGIALLSYQNITDRISGN